MTPYNTLENIAVCGEIVKDASELLFYTHIPTAGVALAVSLFIFFKSRSDTTSQYLLILASLFSLWSLLDLVVWLQYDHSTNLMFAWSLFGIVTLGIYIYSFLFIRSFLNNGNKGTGYSWVLYILALPAVIFLPTQLNLTHFHAVDCVALEYNLYTQYYLLTSLCIALAIIPYTIYKWRQIPIEKKKSALFLLIGMELFLLTFFSIIWGIDYAISQGYFANSDYSLEQYAFFSMPVFITFLAYVIVRFKAFNIKLAAAQALVVGIIALVGSQLFFVETLTNYTLVSLTLIFTILGGYFLVKSVTREIQQREQLEVLTSKLAAANDRLKELDKLKSEFVSIASHQMRSPLTSMRGYASMVLDGSYGSIPDKAREAIQRIADSSAFMAKMIENYLNVSRIESGNMKYELSDFNLKLETEKVVDDKRQEAMKKGLLLTFKSNLQEQGIVHADIGKTLEIIHNLLNNALKYTPKGSIDVLVHDDPKKKKIYVDIHDSGIGMNPEDVTKLFGKFERAQNANSVNITGTGLGLYVARTMALAMKGEITAMSEGQGKGSTFRFELTEVM